MFESVDWAKIGLAAFSQRQASKANERAANVVEQGALNRIQAEDSAARERNAIAREGAALANARLQKISDEAAPDLRTGTQHFRSVMAEDPGTLTPSQVIGLEDARRTVVRSPVFRTSGRGTTAAIHDIEGRVRAGAIDANRRRQDQAAGALVARGNQAVAAQTQQANVDLSTAREAGAAVQAAGQAGGVTTADAANTRAQGELATSQSMMNVLGNIIAGEDKDRYKSRYRSSGAEI